MSLTIDASVFVAASQPHEAQFASSARFLDQVQQAGLQVFDPTLVLPESSAAIARPTGDLTLGLRIMLLVQSFPGLTLVAYHPRWRSEQPVSRLSFVFAARTLCISLSPSFTVHSSSPGMEICSSVADAWFKRLRQTLGLQ
jgi:hypothetical protein